MNDPELYHKSVTRTNNDSEKMLLRFADFIKWRSDGGDSVLDAGCGAGHNTYNVILPFLPENFKRLVGVDLSPNMIEFCRKRYSHSKLSFEVFNLDVEVEKQSLHRSGLFDHIFSFYTLQWIPNQSLCLHNFHKLLKPGGDMLLVFLGYHPIYDVYKELSLDIKWAAYMADAHLRVSPYHHSKNPAQEFRKLLSDCRFMDYKIEVNHKYYDHTLEDMKSKMASRSLTFFKFL